MKLLNLKKKQGFTLVELLIVIVILGIIAALVLPRLFSQPEKARMAHAGNTLGIMGRTLEARAQMTGAGGNYLDIDVSSNWNQLSLAEDPDMPDWDFQSGSGNVGVNIVRAVRLDGSTSGGTAIPVVCTGGDQIDLNTRTGAYIGAGCYAVGNEYDAEIILRGIG